MELTLSQWEGLSTKKFQPECVNEESSTERRSQDLSPHWLDKIRKAFSS